MPHLLSRLVLRRKARAEVDVAAPAMKCSTFQPLELPDDLRCNPFSRATFSPNPLCPKLMEPAEESSEAFRIMDLPPELRLRILTFCFGNRTLACRFDGEKLQYRLWPQGGLTRAKSTSLALLRTSRQLGGEAMEALLNGTTFIVTVEANEEPYSTWHPSIYSTLRLLPASTVRHAVFYFNVWGSAELEVCRKATEVFDNLKTVDLHFDFGCLDCFDNEDGRIFDHFLAAKFNKVRSMSCIGYLYERHALATKKQYLPHSKLDGFQALVHKFKAVDVSDQQCGSTLPCLLDSVMYDVDTSLLNDDDD